MRRGFTLIETIYSTLILALVVIAIFNLYPSSFLAIKRGEGTLQADLLAQSILDDVRSKPFSSIYDPSKFTVNYPTPAPVIYGGTTYTPSVTTFAVQNSTTAGNYIVGCNVTVQFKLQNQTKSVTHQTYIHNITR